MNADKKRETTTEILSKREICTRLKAMADEMQEIGLAMEYFGGFAYWASHSHELIGAASITLDWVREMQIESEADQEPLMR